MNALWAGMMLMAIIYGTFHGTIPAVTQAALDSAKAAVSLCITTVSYTHLDVYKRQEYSYQTIAYHGTHTNLAVTKKYTTGAPHFIEIGHVQPSGLSEEMLKKVRSVMYPALDALKITDGASHGEFRITPEAVSYTHLDVYKRQSS